MKIRQWEIWKAKPPGWEKDHWFLIITGQEICDNERIPHVNGLPCYTLRGSPSTLSVVLDRSDGFDAPTEMPCYFFHGIPKRSLHSGLGLISWERQQQIKAKIRELFRLL